MPDSPLLRAPLAVGLPECSNVRFPPHVLDLLSHDTGPLANCSVSAAMSLTSPWHLAPAGRAEKAGAPRAQRWCARLQEGHPSGVLLLKPLSRGQLTMMDCRQLWSDRIATLCLTIGM